MVIAALTLTADGMTLHHADIGRVAVIGRGKLGTALAGALRRAGFDVGEPLGRGGDIGAARVVLLCVPDDEIAHAASTIRPGPLVGHCSGALTLSVLGGHDAFSLHPLLSVTKETTSFAGCACAIAARTDDGRRVALTLARLLDMRPIEIADELRPLYHAAASVAAGYVVSVAAFAEDLMSRVNVDRSALAPLVRSAVDNWAHDGARALTGPIARGDEGTVARHRRAIEQHSPESLAFWDELTAATRALAVSSRETA
jgi:predicted short-subunit dehydrogenase-like oxidoreductase (DUF2520 family)